MKTFLKIAGIGLFLVALVAAVGAGFAAAQAQNNTAAGDAAASTFSPRQVVWALANQVTGQETPMGPGPHRGGHGFGLAQGLIDHKAIMADALGITVEELEAAHAEGKRLPELVAELGLDLDTVRANIHAGLTEAINQAVTDGTITQAQADMMLQRLEMRTLAHELIDMQAIVADALGITVEELEAARAEGKTIPQLIDELGLDRVEVRESIRAGREAAINQALAEGTITQEQADWLLNQGGRGAGRGFGGPGGRGGHHGFGGDCPNMTPSDTETIPTDEA